VPPATILASARLPLGRRAGLTHPRARRGFSRDYEGREPLLVAAQGEPDLLTDLSRAIRSRTARLIELAGTAASQMEANEQFRAEGSRTLTSADAERESSVEDVIDTV